MESKNSELKVSFGPFNEKNAELVRALNLAIFPVQYHNWFYQALSNYVKYTRLAYFNDILVGAIACREELKDNVKCLYILTFGVLKPYRRYHIGSQLFDDVLKEVRKDKSVKFIYLNVQVGNTTACKFYERYGFEVKETMENYYTDIQPADAHVLRLNLE